MSSTLSRHASRNATPHQPLAGFDFNACRHFLFYALIIKKCSSCPIKKQTQPIPLLMARLLPLSLAVTGLLTPSKSLAHNHEKWVTAPDVEPGYIMVGVNAQTLAHHQLKVKKRKGNRVKVDYILTNFDQEPWGIIRFEEQFECKKNKSRFRLPSENEWRDWEPIKDGTYTEIAKEKACTVIPD